MADLVARIRALSDLHGPSGHEAPVAAYLRQSLAEAAWTLQSDPIGNLYASRASAGMRRLLVLVPMDEPGLVVTHIDDQGRAAVAPLGPLTAATLAGTRVVLASGALGVVGVRPSPEEQDKPPAFDRLYLDLGAGGGAQAQALVAIGGPAVPDVRCGALAGGLLCGKALGNRAACAAALQALIGADSSPEGQPVGAGARPASPPSSAFGEVTVAFLAQSEVGHRGVRPAVQRVRADLVISIGPASETDARTVRASDVRLGGGPVLVVSDRGLVASAPALDALAAAAARAKVTLQTAAADPGRAAAGPALMAATGAPAGALGLAVRHRHTGAEVCDPEDVAAVVRVLGALISGT